MQIQKINRQQNLTFGTAHIQFHRSEVDNLPVAAKRAVNKLITSGLKFTFFIENRECLRFGTVSKGKARKHLLIDFNHGDSLIFKYTHSDSNQELKMIKLFEKIFKDKFLHTFIK